MKSSRTVLCVVFCWLAMVPVFGQTESASPVTVEQFGLFEVELKAQVQYENPYREVTGDVTIRPPDGGMPRRALLFWDGGQTWRLRFSPDRLGDWTYSVVSSDRALNGKGGSFRCVASARAGSITPMKGYTHHFQRQNGKPFWFLGDTAWGLFTDDAAEKHGREQAFAYLAARSKQGINVVHAMLLSEAGWGNHGGMPWEALASERLNPGYWQEVDRRIAEANRQGLVCGLALAWADKRKREPFAWRMFPDSEARQRYARYFAARYSAYDTYFLVSGEWHGEVRTRPSTEEVVRREFIEIGNALREADPHERMVGIHPMTSHGSVREFVGTAKWMSFGDYQQNYVDLHERVLQSRAVNLPVVNSEYGYFLRDSSGDGVPDKDNSTSLTAMRHATWDIAMAGGYPVTGFGTTYFGGNRDPGPFDLEAARNDPWETEYGFVKTILSEREWWKLEPQDDLLSCAEPRGREGREFKQVVPPAVTYWCLAEAGSTYVVYLRGLKSPLTLQLPQRTAGYRTTRIDPRTSLRTELRLPMTDRCEIVPPDDQDWVVLIEALAP